MHVFALAFAVVGVIKYDVMVCISVCLEFVLLWLKVTMGDLSPISGDCHWFAKTFI